MSDDQEREKRERDRRGRSEGPRERHNLLLVSAATVVSVLLVIFVVQDLARQPVLVTSLASSAFLLYWQPLNEVNRFRPLVLGHLLAVTIGYVASQVLPVPYVAASVSLTVAVFALALLRIVHPPAVSTSLVFSYQERELDTLLVFVLTLAVVVVLALIYVLLRHVVKPSRFSHLFDLEEP